MIEKLEKWLKNASTLQWVWYPKEKALFKPDWENFPLSLEEELDDVLGYAGIEKSKRRIDFYFQQEESWSEYGQLIVSIVWVDNEGYLNSILNYNTGIHYISFDVPAQRNGKFYDE